MAVIVHSLISLILASMRICGAVSKSFQAAAHIYVGVIFTTAYFSVDGQFYLLLGVIISIVELTVFLVTKKATNVLPADH